MINIGHQFVKYGLSLLKGKFAVNTKARDDVDAIVEGTAQIGTVNTFLIADTNVLSSVSGTPNVVKGGHSAVSNNELIIADGETLIVEGTVTIKNENSVATVPVPTSAISPGVIGEIAIDDTHFYICTNVNVWKRSSLGTW
jgi:hypothetical protein